jgi:hypothetical protein
MISKLQRQNNGIRKSDIGMSLTAGPPDGRAVTPVSAIRAHLGAEAHGAGSYLFKAIANSVERLNHIERRVNRPKLSAQSFDMAVDGTVIDIDLIVVGGIHERIAAFDHPRSAHQRLKN